MFPPQPLSPEDPSKLGPYTTLGQLGAGGMGIVYLARDEDGQRVAIKVIKPELAADPRFRKRFRREADHARRVARSFIAPVLDADFDGRQPFLVTEYIAGPSLSEYVRQHGPMSPSDVERLAFGVVSALYAIHAVGLVHRDLKPGNVVLGSAGPRVIDFGIARALDDTSRLTSSGMQPGTPEFMAPEQFDKDGEATTATDVFAWGGLVLFARTGEPPFGRASDKAGVALAALGYRVRYQQPKPTALEAPLRELVQAAMAKEPSDRPTAQELLRRLMPNSPPMGADRPTVATEQRRRRSTVAPEPLFRAPSGAALTVARSEPGQVASTGVRRPFSRLGLLAGSVATMLLVAMAGLIAWWLFRAIAAHAGMVVFLAAECVLGVLALVGGGLLVARLADDYPGASLVVGVALLAAVVAIPFSSYHGLHDRYWVGFDHGRIAILKGAGPGGFGFLHIHNASVVERFDTDRERLPPLVADTLEYGIEITSRAEGQRVAHCLPLVFTPMPDAPVGPGDDAALCASRILDILPWMSVPQPITLPDTTDQPPALLATGDRILLAWTAKSDGHLRLRSSTDGMHFSAPVTLPATSENAPALATDGTRVFVAWSEPDGRLAVMSSADGLHFGDAVRLEQTSATAPALAYGDGKLLLAWVGDANHLHVMASPDGLKFGEDTTLDDTSEIAPDLLFADHNWYLSWIGRSDRRVNVARSSDGLSFAGKVVLDATSEYRPAMTVRTIWFLAWTRFEDDGLGVLLSKGAGADFVNELALAEQSSGVSLATFHGHVLLAWCDDSDQPAIHVATLA